HTFICFSFFSFFFFSSRRRHTRSKRDWSSDVCSSDLYELFPSRFDHLFVSIRSLVLHLPVDKFPCLYYGSNIMHIQYVPLIKLTPHFSICNACAVCFFSFFLLRLPTLAITTKPIISLNN